MKFFLDANVLIDLANDNNDALTVAINIDKAGARHCAGERCTVAPLLMMSNSNSSENEFSS